jgi:hypothetical protein
LGFSQSLSIFTKEAARISTTSEAHHEIIVTFGFWHIQYKGDVGQGERFTTWWNLLSNSQTRRRGGFFVGENVLSHQAGAKIRRIWNGWSWSPTSRALPAQSFFSFANLENALERAVVMGSTELLLPEDLPDAVLESGVDDEISGMDYHTAVKKFKREVIL